MKSDSRNEFWHSTQIEKGVAELTMYKFYEDGECNVAVCSMDQKTVHIQFGDRLIPNFFSTDLPVSEAREFANIILRVADAIDKKTSA
ncbi:MAG: hypothetical protein Q3X95_00660 [Duodenibacillus sp.]|nr:hypothetical protein [Duodenibacillus sp.]